MQQINNAPVHRNYVEPNQFEFLLNHPALVTMHLGNSWIIFLQFSGPVKSRKMRLVLDSPRN